MVVEYIRYAVKDEARRKELVAAYVEAAKSLDAAPECLAYEMTVCEEDATAAVLRIEWTSTEAHLEGFRKSASSAVSSRRSVRSSRRSPRCAIMR
jgi:quinol monooxygenase YgiN